MTSRQLWAKLRLDLYKFQTIERSSNLYAALITKGVSQHALDSYIDCGRGRKHPDCSEQSSSATRRQVYRLVSAGGHMSGGAAVRRFMDLDDARDYDIFFPDITSFAAAHLATYENPSIDICLFNSKPYELFDLAACKCSYDAQGLSTDPSFDKAMTTGISDIALDAVVDPTATLRRVAKYGAQYGFKFPMEKILIIAATDGVDKTIAFQAMDHAV